METPLCDYGTSSTTNEQPGYLYFLEICKNILHALLLGISVQAHNTLIWKSSFQWRAFPPTRLLVIRLLLRPNNICGKVPWLVLVGCVSKPLNLKETPITQMTQSPLWAATGGAT